MPLVSVLATGGTIASRSDGGGAATARDAGADLVARAPDLPPGVEVRVEDVFTVSGFRMTLDRVHTLARAVSGQLRDPDVAGVVVTHGTDTTEETAFFLDRFHDDVPARRPDRRAAGRRRDGQPTAHATWRDAVTVAASPAARGPRRAHRLRRAAVPPARGTVEDPHARGRHVHEPLRRCSRLGTPGRRRGRDGAPSPPRPSTSPRSTRPACGWTSSPATPDADATALRAFADAGSPRPGAGGHRGGQRQPDDLRGRAPS